MPPYSIRKGAKSSIFMLQYETGYQGKVLRKRNTVAKSNVASCNVNLVVEGYSSFCLLSMSSIFYVKNIPPLSTVACYILQQ